MKMNSYTLTLIIMTSITFIAFPVGINDSETVSIKKSLVLRSSVHQF